MFITALLIICAILFIIAMLHLTDTAYTKHNCKKYQEHIDNLVTELFPPATPAVQTPAVNTYTPTHNESNDQQEDTVQEVTVQEVTVQYRETKREMVANIRTYFNQRKLNEAIRDTEIAIRETEIKTGLPMNSPMFSSRPYTRPDTPSLPTPPSLQRILE